MTTGNPGLQAIGGRAKYLSITCRTCLGQCVAVARYGSLYLAALRSPRWPWESALSLPTRPYHRWSNHKMITPTTEEDWPCVVLGRLRSGKRPGTPSLGSSRSRELPSPNRQISEGNSLQGAMPRRRSHNGSFRGPCCRGNVSLCLPVPRCGPLCLAVPRPCLVAPGVPSGARI